MEMKTILIIILIAFIWYSYNNPNEGKEWIDKGVDQAQSLFDKAKSSVVDQPCPSDDAPVCANGVEYGNYCLAEKQGITDYTIGGC